jgi:tetratricopeptide (TPR) repeat protein
VHCGRALFSVPLSRSGLLPGGAAAPRGGAWWTRGLIVAGLLLACAFGLVVRKTFRGASLEATAPAAPVSAPDPAPTARPASMFTPPPSTGRDFAKGRALLEKGDVRGALRELTPVAQAEPDNAVIAHTYGRALWAAGSRDRAVMQLERAARIDPHTPIYRVDLANALAALRRTREAIREYESAVSLDPGNADSVMALAALYARAGAGAESRALLQRAAMLRPGDSEIARRLADLDAREGPRSYAPAAAPPPPTASDRPAASGVVYTEEDLRRAGTGRIAGAVPPQTPPAVVRPAADQLGEDRAIWRGKAAERKEAVRSAQQHVAEVEARVQDLQHRAEQAAADPDVLREVAKAQEDLDSRREKLARAQRRWEELKDEARRKGLPPDWLR